jgi:hypothetical protein
LVQIGSDGAKDGLRRGGGGKEQGKGKGAHVTFFRLCRGQDFCSLDA